MPVLAGDGKDALAAIAHKNRCTTSNVEAMLTRIGLRQASAGSPHFTAGPGAQHSGMFALAQAPRVAADSRKQVVCLVLQCLLACEQTPPVGSGR